MKSTVRAGKPASQIKAERLGRLETLRGHTGILTSVVGIGTVSETFVNFYEIEWQKANILDPMSFYSWPEEVRWLFTLTIIFSAGITANLFLRHLIADERREKNE